MYILKSTKFFSKQLEESSVQSLRIIREKINLLKINPFRYKRIKGYKLLLFRIRFSDKRKEKRIIYLINKEEVILICILDRSKDYKDLNKYIKEYLRGKLL